MHGRPRQRLPEDPVRDKDEQSKIAHLESLLAEVLRNHRGRCYTKEALQKNARLLEINPEVYTAWNFRKLAVKQLLESEKEDTARRSILGEELQVVERALKHNYKSYGAWYHRKWVVNFGLSSLDHEFHLLDKFLVADNRNFHGWHYRRFAVCLKNISEEEELQYSIRKINENFSNYSAWHYRSVLLSKIFKNKLSEKLMQQEVLTEEYELVKQAFFTEPDDQSAWLYHLWVVDQTVAPLGPRLMGCWPSNGFTLTQSMIEASTTFVWGFYTPFKSNHCLHGQALYSVLCFSEPVLGVSAKTIVFKSTPEIKNLCEVDWRPVSESGAGSSSNWVGEIILPSSALGDRINYSFQMLVGIVPGIYSKDGQSFLGPILVNFILEWKPASLVACHNENFIESILLWPSKNATVVQSFSRVWGHGGKDLVNALSVKPNTGLDGGIEWQVIRLESQIVTCRELLSIEKDSKWAKLTLARLLMAYNNLAGGQFVNHHYTDEMLQLFKDLVDIDPTHSYYYKEQYSIVLMDKMTNDSQKLQGYWWESEESDATVLNNCGSNGWLRLHELSLSKLAFLERLLWVQRLDLSYNMLQSLDGLEALQLLVCLDISHNVLSHVTSLGPICSIKSLAALNISHNEIGGHMIDTYRYSFPSLHNHSMEDAKAEKCRNEGRLIEGGSWEVAAVFGCMQLKQLEIYGNPLANNDVYRKQLIELIPTLIWLDGVEVSYYL